MIEWESFVLVAVVSLVAASVIVTIASIGIRLLENATHAQKQDPRQGKVRLAVARTLFGVCGVLVLFGVYLIVPAFH
ncbi:MAG: hypothetical protein KF739_02400 [Cryobacterium sp.]|nr:hypothetical protein [Micrococcales bacterium]MBX3309268.1 hypothetical protein [Cryobacterium sp.]HNP16032.1 hypothetical protein [Terrimesophilobacter sp.]